MYLFTNEIILGRDALRSMMMQWCEKPHNEITDSGESSRVRRNCFGDALMFLFCIFFFKIDTYVLLLVIEAHSRVDLRRTMKECRAP